MALEWSSKSSKYQEQSVRDENLIHQTLANFWFSLWSCVQNALIRRHSNLFSCQKYQRVALGTLSNLGEVVGSAFKSLFVGLQQPFLVWPLSCSFYFNHWSFPYNLDTWIKECLRNFTIDVLDWYITHDSSFFCRNLIRGQLLPFHEGDPLSEEPGGKVSSCSSYLRKEF